MISFVEYTDFSLLAEVLSRNCDFNFVDYLIEKKLPVKKFSIENWSDLGQIISENDGFFTQETAQNYLVNIGSLKTDKNTLKFLQSLDFADLKLYLYSAEIDGLSADLKKLIKGAFELVSLKKTDQKLALEIAQKYAEKIALNLSPVEFQKLTKQVLSYQEIIDNLDFVNLSGDSKLAIQCLFKEEELPVFMYGFRTDKLKEDSLKWYKKISEEELQLGLSLIYGKLEKQNNLPAKKLQKELILTDKKIKTTAGVSPTVWWKLFLWKAGQVSFWN